MKQHAGEFGLWMLAWPIFIEIFLQTLLGTVDTIMVSRISDDAVAVVGISNQLFGALTTLFTTFAGGAGILIAQRMGSRRIEDARTLAIMGVTASSLLGVIVSIFLFLYSNPIARMLNISEELLPLSHVYIAFVGGGLFMVGMTASLGTAIRNTGNTRGPMYTGVVVNVIHIILNYLLIFGRFGLPELGLAGIAVSNVVSRLLGVVVLFYMFSRAFEQTIRLRDFLLFKWKLFSEILKISWPLGLNSSSWVFSQLAIYSFLAMLGAQKLAARTYLNTMESFCFTLGYAVAMAGQIQIAHLFGAGRIKRAYRAAYRTLFIGLVVVSSNVLLLFIFGKTLLGFFTSNQEIISIGVSLLALNLILQPCKMLNMAISSSLNAIGDTRYTMFVSLFSMSLIGIGGSYWIGIEAGWGLIGIYSCMIADEAIRGLLVLIRWRNRKVLRKAEVQLDSEHTSALSNKAIHLC
ncbi:MATE family efflux transporter [Paenibacillus wynnii]|uniref:MATE family efflux transporter n=1 Tax=Paenibacillus wynnii TaxID=268407 RepID=UPI002791DD66|nr:MATE family efflux transporter [Paenibacillus wynnii]MDQ0193736.1 putative MATE family efflux protein [Paenibacillus wynnii]